MGTTPQSLTPQLQAPQALPQQAQGGDELPDPGQFGEGVVIEDDVTGQRYRNERGQWIPI